MLRAMKSERVCAAMKQNDGGLQRVNYIRCIGVTIKLVRIVPQGSLWRLRKEEDPSA
jgi:hypothetical protein